MDGLDEFERNLAAEKAERDKTDKDGQERRHRKHRHAHRHEHDDNEYGANEPRRRHHEDDGHAHKKSRHSRHDGNEDHPSRHKRHGRHDGNENQESRSKRRDCHDDDDKYRRHRRSTGRHSPEDTDLRNKAEGLDAPVRDSWMTGPFTLDVEHLHRVKPKTNSPSRQEPKRVIHARELNQNHLRNLNDKVSTSTDAPIGHAARTVDYTFGDSGSSWRLTRLRGVYTTAESNGRPVEEVAVEQYGSLQDFDDAREEKEEMERRRIYGSGYREKEKPTGRLYLERKQEQKHCEQDRLPYATLDSKPEDPGPGTVIAEQPPSMDQTSLNRLRAQMMKAKLRRAPNAAQLEQEYNRAASLASSASSNAPRAVVLGTMHNSQLAGPRGEVKPVNTRRGRERGLVEENADMTIEDMVREERRTKNAPGGEALRLAERIAKDGKFDNDLEYMDENASKLAQRVHKGELSLKNMAVTQFQKMNRVLESCPLCHHEEQNRPPLAPVVSLATRVFLTLTPEPEISPGGAVIVPLSHRTNLLECDDDEWEEMRNFMKALTRMYHEQGREVIFYENAAAPHRHLHAAMVAVPIPYSEGATAPAYFKEAFLSSDEEWTQHRKIIDTGARAREGMGRMAFRRSLAKEMPYFHVWFTLDGGLGHVVEDADRWPRGDLFAREVLGGIVDAEPGVAKKQGRWVRNDERVEGWRRAWRKFDWTRVLQESS